MLFLTSKYRNTFIILYLSSNRQN